MYIYYIIFWKRFYIKASVTDGAGFIGSHVAEKLIVEEFEVCVLDDLSMGLEENLVGNVKFFNMNICDKNILSIFEKEQFDFVVHLAAQTSVNESVNNPYIDANII